MTHKNEGKFILSARKSAGLLQYELAKKLGVTAQFLGRIEKGDVSLPLDKAQLLTIITHTSLHKYAAARLKDYKQKLINDLDL